MVKRLLFQGSLRDLRAIIARIGPDFESRWSKPSSGHLGSLWDLRVNSQLYVNFYSMSSRVHSCFCKLVPSSFKASSRVFPSSFQFSYRFTSQFLQINFSNPSSLLVYSLVAFKTLAFGRFKVSY